MNENKWVSVLGNIAAKTMELTTQIQDSTDVEEKRDLLHKLALIENPKFIAALAEQYSNINQLRLSSDVVAGVKPLLNELETLSGDNYSLESLIGYFDYLVPRNDKVMKSVSTKSGTVPPDQELNLAVTHSAEARGVEPELITAVITNMGKGMLNKGSITGLAGQIVGSDNESIMGLSTEIANFFGAGDIRQDIDAGTAYLKGLLIKNGYDIDKTLYAFVKGINEKTLDAAFMTTEAAKVEKTSEAGISLLKKFEGFRATTYRDTGNTLTIGYGTIEGVKEGDTITKEEASTKLVQHVKGVEKKILEEVKVPITQNQMDALVSFTYNLGKEAFATSTLLKKLNRGDKEGAAEEFDRWVYAGGKVEQGLVNRRKAEKELFLKEESPKNKEYLEIVKNIKITYNGLRGINE
jgi:lysozyme